MIVRVGWDFCCAVLEEIFLPGKKTRTPVVHVNIHSSSVAPEDVGENDSLLTTGAFQRGLSRAGRCAPFAQ